MISHPYRFLISVIIVGVSIICVNAIFIKNFGPISSFSQEHSSIQLDLTRLTIINRYSNPIENTIVTNMTQQRLESRTYFPNKNSAKEKVDQASVDHKPLVNDRSDQLEDETSSFPSSAISATDQETVYRQYLARVYEQIAKAKSYPKVERRRRHEGVVSLRFTILRTGDVQSVELVDRSDFSRLDQAAVAAVEQSAPFPNFPLSFTDDSLVINMDIVFELK